MGYSSWGMGGSTSDPMNGRCKLPEQGSVQKNREIWGIFVKTCIFGHLESYTPAHGYAYVRQTTILDTWNGGISGVEENTEN